MKIIQIIAVDTNDCREKDHEDGSVDRVSTEVTVFGLGDDGKVYVRFWDNRLGKMDEWSCCDP